MTTVSWWYVTVVLNVGGKQREIHGPSRDTEEEAKKDLAAVQEKLGAGEWINLDWLSADPKHVVAAYLDGSAIGFG